MLQTQCSLHGPSLSHCLRWAQSCPLPSARVLWVPCGMEPAESELKELKALARPAGEVGLVTAFSRVLAGL